MASLVSSRFILQLFFVVSLFHISFAARKLTELVQDQTNLLQYHHGPLLSGKISINLIWYGKFNPTQRAIISDFVISLSSSPPQTQPSVANWWKTTQNYYHLVNSKKPSSLSLSLGKQILDENYSLGKSLTEKQIKQLASKADQIHAVNVVLTASDVTVDGFCMSRCGTHGSSKTSQIKGRNYKFAYIWVGNSETQCPGQCAWPFHQPMYGPQTPPLVAPNNDVGLDGMLINLASLLAGTVTNPFGNGYYQGPADAALFFFWFEMEETAEPTQHTPSKKHVQVGCHIHSTHTRSDAALEAASACPGVYGKGAYPGYPGDLLVDPTTGASYNAHGANGRKYLLPALYDPATSSCSTLN